MLTIIYIIVVTLVLVVFVRNCNRKRNAICKSKTRLDGKTTLITGGTAGMGLEVAIDFASRGARVIVACPFPNEGADALETIIIETGNRNVVFKLLNLASLESVRQFAADVANNEERLDILINNAGVATKGLCTTKDGLNFIMQVNYFGHFLLTLLLLPLLIKTGKPSAPSRIVNTASLLHRYGNIDIGKLNGSGYWYLLKSYANSKLALILFTRELASRLEGAPVVVNAVDPGVVGTNIYYGINSLVGKVTKFLLRNMYKTPWEGAQTAIHVAVDQAAGALSGQFFSDCTLALSSRGAHDGNAAKLMWDESVHLVKLTEDDLTHCFEHFKDG